MSNPTAHAGGLKHRFMTNPYPRRPIDCEEAPDHKAALARMKGRIPKRAYDLGRFEKTIADRPGYTWSTEEHYYLLPGRGPKKAWELIRISWDDNDERYEWADGVVGSGFASANEAACALLGLLYRKWRYDLSDLEYEAEREYLEALRGAELISIGERERAGRRGRVSASKKTQGTATRGAKVGRKAAGRPAGRSSRKSEGKSTRKSAGGVTAKGKAAPSKTRRTRK